MLYIKRKKKIKNDIVHDYFKSLQPFIDRQNLPFYFKTGYSAYTEKNRKQLRTVTNKQQIYEAEKKLHFVELTMRKIYEAEKKLHFVELTMRTLANSHEKAKIDWHCLKYLISSQRCRTKFHAFETVETGELRILKES